MPDIKIIADKADIIVNGYAFTREEDGIHVLNLNNPDKAVVYCPSNLVSNLVISHNCMFLPAKLQIFL